MDFELGHKLNRAAADFICNIQNVKDDAGPPFWSAEADAMFVLTAHLKGYKRKNLKIEINKDETLIAISGERHVIETLTVGWNVPKKDTETKRFIKVFRVPDGVILDMIKANYNEGDSSLKITMPKKVRGVRGTNIEEIKEKHEFEKAGSSILPIGGENANTRIKGTSPDGNRMCGETLIMESGEQNIRDSKEGEKAGNAQETFVHENDIQADKRLEYRDDGEAQNEEEHKPRRKRCKMCIPVVAGSTLLLSIVVFAFHFIRSKNRKI
ncbi:hypothetical protein OROGR_026401 [Orobanche gracilis]